MSPRQSPPPQSASPVIHGGQRQKTARLRRILRNPGNGAQARRIKITPQRDRHGEPPSFATLNQIRAVMGIPSESRSQRLGISAARGEPSARMKIATFNVNGV